MKFTNDTALSTPTAPGSAVDWYKSRMALSGITAAVADAAGIYLEVDDTGAFFIIPYHTVDGVRTLHWRQRNWIEGAPPAYDPAAPSSGSRGKYTQPPRSKNVLYWPPLESQRMPYNDPGKALLICEGELKALAAQMAFGAIRYGGLVCGVPGTQLSAEVRAELTAINYCGAVNGVEVHRDVFLAMDWNGRGDSREASEECAYQLTRLLEPLGARVTPLRWPLSAVGLDGVAYPLTGEQKLDDWLVTHRGDLGLAMVDTLKHREVAATELSLLQQDLTTRYYRYDNQYIPVRNITKRYSSSEFNGVEAFHTYKPTRRKQDNLSPHEIVGLLPEAERNTVYDFVFEPSPLGMETRRIVHRKGVRMLNVAPPAVVVDAPPFAVDLSPWHELVGRLCIGDGAAEWFTCFLAHCAQHPTVKGHHIVVFQDDGATGKSTLFDTIELVFGELCGPIGDAIMSRFNEALQGKVIGHVSEVIVERREDRGLIARIKAITGDRTLAIEGKGVKKFFVENRIRVLLATNLDFIVPVERGERRWAIFGGDTPWDREEVKAFVHWRDHEGGVDAIRQHLIELDLSGFDIHTPAPHTAKRAEMEMASATDLVQRLEEGVFLLKDLWTASEIQELYQTQFLDGRRAPSLIRQGKMLAKAGCVQRKVFEGGVRLWCIRNYPLWENRPLTDWEAEWGKFQAPGAKY